MLTEVYGARQLIALILRVLALGIAPIAPIARTYTEPDRLVSECIVNPIVRPA